MSAEATNFPRTPVVIAWSGLPLGLAVLALLFSVHIAVGASYLLGVDIIARVAIAPREISTGIITAMVGAPLFIHLVRQRAR